MVKQFNRDRIENEKTEPQELSSIRFVYIPLMLLSAFIGFGVTYLSFTTTVFELGNGDSRTQSQNTNEDHPNAGSDKVDPKSLYADGKALYAANCQACHQASGMGIAGAFPPLSESEFVTKSPKRLAAIVLHGIQGPLTVNGQLYNGIMPSFAKTLKDKQIASVLTYIRGSWQNDSSAITAETIKEVRDQTISRTTAWNGDDDLDNLNFD